MLKLQQWMQGVGVKLGIIKLRLWSQSQIQQHNQCTTIPKILTGFVSNSKTRNNIHTTRLNHYKKNTISPRNVKFYSKGKIKSQNCQNFDNTKNHAQAYS
eukprot:TRINITY_DN2343_c0_g1_i3.p11 TRINITY_DN2343_c0_g1~~TRINITY_DN2343_c0_g1_i3.p11  ORF type:complete len:100 (-),score=6.23 TRINITY_DN2343_c0_g1_i3:571-870(-)